MAEEELKIDDGGGKKKLPLIIGGVVAALAIGAAGYFFLFAGDDAPAAEQLEDAAQSQDAQETAAAAATPAKTGTALYVAMPRPFVFNVPGVGRERLVQIKVQLLVRGSDNEEAAKSHIPMIEGTLLQVFSNSSADDLVTEAGKIALREKSVSEVKRVMKDIVGQETVEQVLFTGFVMQ